MSKNEQMVGISRRTLVKSTAIGSLALAAGGFSLPFTLRSAEAAVQQANEKVVWGACSVNCGSRCALRLHVKDNEVTWVETDNTGSDEYGNHQVRACLRGRSIRRRINHPDRLNYPMKRVGKRGEGKFERISWDEALDTIASSLKKTVKQYGNEAVYIQYSSGIVGGNMTRSSPSASAVKRLMNCYGGSLNQYGSYSTAQISCAMPYTYGSNDGNSTTDIENSKLVVMFGNNPAETRMSGGGITYLLEKAREKSNAKMIVIDPRYTDTAAGREDEWLPIRPGTDAALVAGIAWVLINENLVDQPFLDKYCVGYDEKTLPADAPKNGHYKAYILGEGDDKTAKTPQWASQITGIPVDRIIKLAREIGTAKPAYICQGWGPQRQANGELTARAIAMLPILTGNVGISGGNSGARESTYTITIERLPVLDNPVKTSISCFSWTDAIDHGPQMTAIRDGVRGKDKLDVPIKFIWNYAGNTLVNQHSDINKTHEILQDESKCEMIVVIENFMTSSAKYADILLPDLMTVEQEDIIPNDYAGNMGYLIFLQPVTSEKFERKPIYWILSEVAKRLGPDVYQKFTEGRTQEQWLQHLYAKMLAKDPALPSYDELKKMGIYKRKDPNGHFVAYKAFRDDPEANPLKTPSGKIEIYSSKLAEIARTWELEKDEVISPLPVYASTFEGWDSPERSAFPLQLFGFHYKSRTHSTYGNIDVLKAACRQEVWINPIDAQKRGFERKPIYWMLSEVAKRLGPDVYQTFTEGRSQHEWIKYLHAKTKERNPEMPDYEEMKTTGIFKKKCPEEHYVAFRAFRVDPQANPLKTPSGKIEIYSERLAKIADTWELKKDEIIHPLPAYTPGFDGWDDPLRKTYPLQLTGFHYKARTHSSYGNIDVLQQACPQEVWINPIDAQARGIRHGDTVRVFNNNGEMLIAAKVTPRILPGVTAIGQGAWLKADMFGDRVDHGGSINILTSHRPSPLAKGNPSHSNLVQIEKV